MRVAFRQWLVLARKGFCQNLQYSASHIVNTFASVVFGLIYIYIWQAVTPAEGFGPYTSSVMAEYICFNQSIAWFTQFGMKIRHRIAGSVRSGQIAVELARPMGFFSYRMAFEYGAQLYNLLFRGIPVGVGLALFASPHLPKSAATWLWTLISVAAGGYISICMAYLVGISSFWTNEIRTASWMLYSLQTALGGLSMPLEVLPRPLEVAAKCSPFAHLCYFPARIYLGLSGPESIWAALAWAVVLTFVTHQVTDCARRRLEVQGG